MEICQNSKAYFLQSCQSEQDKEFVMSCSLLETGDEDTLTVSYELDKSE